MSFTEKVKEAIKGKLEKSNVSPIIILGPRDDAEIQSEFKQKAQKKRFCARCLINSNGLKEVEVPGEFCPVCGTKWNLNEVNT